MDLHLDPKTLVRKLSPAEKTGVAVARALLPDADAPARLLVLDEPTARLPESEVELLLGIVRSIAARGIGVMYVTHRLDEVFAVAEQATVLRDGQLVVHEQVSGLTRETLLEQLFGETVRTLERRRTSTSDEAAVLTVRGLTNESLHDVSFVVNSGEVVGVAGITSSGREALCGTIFGARVRDEGSVEVRGTTLQPGRPDRAMAAGVAYVPAERKTLGCLVDLPAKENIAIANLRHVWRFPVLRRKQETTLASEWFHRLQVKPVRSVDAHMSTFSGGNQQKIVYAKWFQRNPSLFLLDEPTQGVDVGAKAELHSALVDAAFGGAGVLVASTDVDELVALCDRVLVLSGGRIVRELTGDDIDAASITRASLELDDDHDLTSAAAAAPSSAPRPRGGRA